MVTFSASDQGALLDLLLGFVIIVVALHAWETVLWAVRLRRWDIASVVAVSCVSLGFGIGWLFAHRSHHGVRFSDLLLALGGQFALLVCVPARCLRRRVCQWERYQLRHTLQGGRPMPPLSAPHLRQPARAPRRATWPFHRNRQPESLSAQGVVARHRR